MSGFKVLGSLLLASKKPLGSKNKLAEFIDQLGAYQLLKDSASFRSYFISPSTVVTFIKQSSQ
jgi:hypothetical protein